MRGAGAARRGAVLAAAFALAALGLFGPFAGPAQAAGAVDRLAQGPAPGAALGAAVRAQDQSGAVRDFRSLRGKRGLLLLFSRSFDW